MTYTIAQAEDDLSGIIHGKTVNKVTNIASAERRAAQNLLAMIDPEETRKISTITLYDQVPDVAAPDGLKEKGIIDIRPQFTTSKDRNLSDNLGNRMSKDFDLRRGWGNYFTVMNNAGVQYLRVEAQLTPSALSLDALDVIGGWTATSGATNLAVEDIIYSQGAFQFNLSAGPTSGYIQSTTIVSQDMTDLVDKSAAFFELYIPTAAALAAIASVNLRWGSDMTANYYDRTVTAAHLGALKVGKNTIRVDWNGATKTGAPVVTAIDSARITINTTGAAISALIVSNLFFSIGQVWDIEFYSKFIFSTTGGVWGETVTDPTDTINLDTASYNLYFYELALAALQQIQGKDALADRQYFYDQLYGNAGKNIEGKYDIYKKNNPSQREKVTQTYYSNLGWRGSGGDRFRRF